MARHGERVLPAYGPASLDFINLPNPVEPHAAPHKHPLNSTSRNERTSEQDFLSIIHNPENNAAGPPVKRRKSGADNGLNLPRLPVRDEGRRLRIPPTLTGLHQPPPDAGLLPSISIDKPAATLELPDRRDAIAGDIQGDSTVTESGHKLLDSAADRRKPRKWSDQETSYLLQGVARFGIGKWTQILNCPDYHFDSRTALDLKDRFRVCCPNEYSTVQKPKVYRSAEGIDIELAPMSGRDRISASKLRSIGIEQPFVRSSRRKRRDYSAEEDEAIRKGVAKHHTAWSTILQDDEFKILRSRLARDLRDRFRTRFPEEYKSLGLAPKPNDVSSRPRPFSKGDSSMNPANESGTHQNDNTPIPAKKPETTSASSHPEDHNAVTAPARRSQTLPSLISTNDVFWGAPLETDEADGEHITLDREIMDWAFETGRSQDQAPMVPTSTISNAQSHPHILQGSISSVLPPIASLTAGTMSENDEDSSQLELPSLMNGLGHLEVDGRTGGQLGGFYDYLG